MGNAHFRTWSMVRKLKIIENVLQRLFDLENVENVKG